MPATTHIEILNGRTVAPSASESALPSTPTPARQGTEAGGHYQTLRVMRCQSCGALSYIEYDSEVTHEYLCSNCHLPNAL